MLIICFFVMSFVAVGIVEYRFNSLFMYKFFQLSFMLAI